MALPALLLATLALAQPVAMQRVTETGDTTVGGAEDHDGILWFGTGSGPVSFDGNQVRRLAGPDKAPLPRVGTITVARDGRLWFGLSNGGVLAYDKRSRSFTRYRHDPDREDSLSSDNMYWAPRLIAEAPDGTLWIGTIHGLNHLDPASGRVKRYLHDPDKPDSLVGNNVWCVMVDRQQRVWVATSSGLSRLDPGSEGFVNYRPDPVRPGSLADPAVYAVAQASDDSIWVGGRRLGLSRLDPQTDRFEALRHVEGDPATPIDDEVFSITPSRDGRLILGRSVATARGLEIYELRSRKFSRYSLVPGRQLANPAETLMSAIVSSRGSSVWLPYNHGTVYQFGAAPMIRQLQPAVQPDVPVQRGLPMLVFARDASGQAWVGGAGGLAQVDPVLGTYTRWRARGAPLDGEVNSIMPIAPGRLWLGMVNGDFLLVDTESREVLRRLRNQRGSSIGAWGARLDPRHPHLLWFATQTAGLGQVDLRSGRYRFFNGTENRQAGISAAWISSIAIAADGGLWLATHGQGLLRFDGERVTDAYQPVAGRAGTIPSAMVNQIVSAGGGRWWVSTMAGGLAHFDEKTGQFATVGTTQGLSEDSVNCTQFGADGLLWVATASTIHRFDVLLGRVTASFSLANTFPNGSMLNFASGMSVLSDGRVYIGSLVGAAILDPALTPEASLPPRVLITELSRDGQALDLATSPELVRQLALPWPVNSFEFKLAVLGEHRGLQRHVRFRLEGFEDKWFHSRPGLIERYVSLPPGRYAMELQAAFGSQPWSSSQLVELVIVPPFWMSGWFRVLAAAALLMLALCVLLYRQRLATRHLARLEAMVDKRTQELLEAKQLAEQAQAQVSLKAGELARLNGSLEERVAERTAALAAANDRLRYENEHDRLTGLCNRRAFDVRLADHWRRDSRRPRALGLLMIDIDHFKTYNDTFGTVGGDAVILSYGQRIEAAFPQPLACCCRFSGDQFVVLLHGVDTLDQVLAAGRRLLEVLLQPVDVEGRDYCIGCSIGAAHASQPTVHSALDLLREADAALAAVKRRGGGELAANDGGHVRAIKRRREIEISLNEMLRNPNEENCILPYYHAIVDAQTGAVVGFEALARWRQGEERLALPADFIDVAIHASKVHLIDLAVLRGVLDDCRAHAHSPVMRGLRFASINVFSTGLRRADFVPFFDEMIEIVSALGLSINIELTEQAPAEDLVHAAQLLRSKGHNTLVSIDDFGTGNSSLAHLLTIQPDMLKIDATFVRGIGVCADQESIVRSTVALAKSLRIALIAEGVESQAQANYLRDLGCEYLQGYLFDRPLPASAFFAGSDNAAAAD